MRILLLGPHPTIRGPLPKHTPHLVAALRSLGCRVTVEPWGRHHDLESLREKVVGRARDLVRIRRAARRDPFDVVVVKTAHDRATLTRDIPLLVALRDLSPRLVLQFHGSFSDRLVTPGHTMFKAASACLMRLCAGALVLSSEEQRQWRQFYPGGRFHVVANPFVGRHDGPPVDRAAIRQRFRLPAQVPLVFFAGRLMKEKGILDVLDALPRVLARTPVHLVLAGDGELAPQVAARAAAANLRGQVTLLGYVQGEALSSAYRCADVFVLPSWWSEGFPVVITEAMDAGLPILTTQIRGMADHLRDGVHALFVPPRSPGELAEALTRLLADAPLRARMGEANREKVKEFAPARVGRDYLDALQHLAR